MAAAAAPPPPEEVMGDGEAPEYINPSALSTDQLWRIFHSGTFDRFLREFGSTPGGQLWETPYGRQAIDIARHGYEGFAIRDSDIQAWEDGTALAAYLATNFLHVWTYLDAAVDAYVKSVLEMYLGLGEESGVDAALINEGTHKTFHLVLESDAPSSTVRELRCEQIGKILRVRGTVTRVSDTRPLLATAAFCCAICGTEQRDIPQNLRYTEPTQCIANRGERPCLNRSLWVLIPELSTYRDWQKLRVQENSGEIPAGSMPRAVDVYVTRSQCDAVRAGDKVIVTGSAAAVPDAGPQDKRPPPADTNETGTGVAGLRKLGVRDLGHRMVLLAASIQASSGGADNETARMELPEDEEDAAARQAEALEAQFELLGATREEIALYLRIAKSDSTIERLAACFVPEVFGCENIKKGILLQLAGGVVKNTGAEGLRLRGDINVCIVGDPGTAKSQLLRAVRNFAPRAVYTAGSTSSAAGLTVAVTRDPDQGGGVIEAGALMLADTGICCIDEFEKMNAKDMVAIHEAVEQQSISVCKGGVHAVLNARTSILAACNPRGGRYDLSMPFRHNVRLSAPIVSRFDLFFALVDSTELDKQIATHILNNHVGGSAATHLATELTKKQLQTYMRVAKDRQPVLSAAAQRLLVEVYVELRAESCKPGAGRCAAVTVRSLESLIRLSEAAAKLKFSATVAEEHVRLAVRVVQTSLIRLKKTRVLLAEDSAETIDAEIYAKISADILDHFRDAETQLAAEGQGAEATAERDELVSWYVDQSSSPEDDEESLMQQYTLVAKVVDRMIAKDMSLIEDVRIMADEDEENAPRVSLLRLHPNLSSTTANFEHPTHATLSTQQLLADKANAAPGATGGAAGLLDDDDDFMTHVYGS